MSDLSTYIIPTSLDIPDIHSIALPTHEDSGPYGMKGTKEGCGSGECGACTILVDGVSKLSCLMLAAQLQGHTINTVEGLASAEALHPVQRAFVEKGAIQCGFCTPGMLMATMDLLNRSSSPDRDQIRRALSGNLCRCTGYQKIVDAVEIAAREMRVSNE